MGNCGRPTTVVHALNPLTEFSTLKQEL